MKASEYIKMLQNIIQNEGDVEVVIDKADGTVEAAIPYFRKRLRSIIVAVPS